MARRSCFKNKSEWDIWQLTKNFRRFSKKLRVVFNQQISNWKNIHAGGSQVSILEPPLVFIYINDLAENLSSNPKLFGDDTSLFSVVRARIPLQMKLMMTLKIEA